MTSRSLKICALVAIAPYFSTYHSTLSSPSRCDTSHERAESPGEWCPSRSLTHCSHISVLGAVTRTSDLQALCRAVLEEAALCCGWSRLRWQFLWNLPARSSDTALRPRWATGRSFTQVLWPISSPGVCSSWCLKFLLSASTHTPRLKFLIWLAHSGQFQIC